MRNRIGKVAWGLTLIAVGVLIFLGAIDVIDAHGIFGTWWPMIIIIPCFFSFLGNNFGGGALVGLTVGVLILLNNLNILDWSMTKKIIIPIILVLLGILVIIKSVTKGHTERTLNMNMEATPEIVSCFSTRNEIFTGRVFEGARAEAIFGTTIIDLRGATVPHDTVINANATFGSVIILVPGNVNFKTHSSNFFGSVSRRDKASYYTDANGAPAPTIHVNSSSVFGGVKIR